MQQTTKRLDHIDIAKAIGLLLVIYGGLNSVPRVWLFAN